MRDCTEEHGKLLAEWRERLALTDWVIVLKDDCLPNEMSLDNVCGEADWTESSKAATIHMLREDCYGDRIVAYDYEKTLVHELLHLKLALLGESGNALQDRLVHQLIDDLARALVDAKRAGGAA